MKIITHDVLNQLSREAARSDRLRKNLNMHDDYNDPCQRLFNALEPGTYIRPHRHVEPSKPECFMAVRGRMALVIFDGSGKVERAIPFGEGCDVIGFDLPAGQWHTVVALEQGSVFFETKPGPFVPLSDKDFAPWAPDEGNPEADHYLSSLIARVAL